MKVKILKLFLKKGIIIQGSSRSEGHTSKIVSILKETTGFDSIDLNQLNIGHFDYEFKNRADDFIALFKNIVTNYNSIIFVTPIYWYAMSGIMKVFFDRISDFLVLEKDYGRLLRGKEMASIRVSNDKKYYEGFEMPFKNSAAYLGMLYKGHLHTWVEREGVTEKMKNKIHEFVTNKL